MQVDQVILKNIGPFADYSTEFRHGLIGIVGRNGQGKSTLVNAVYAALTNDWSRFHGVKADQIYNLADVEEEAFVEVECQHDGQAFTIRRGLRPNQSALIIPGEIKITKAGEIEERLQRDLGVDAKLIGNYVFVNQWSMFAFLSQTPAQRAEAFRHLCQTDQANLAFTALGAMVDRHRLGAEFVDNSDELVTRVSESEERLLVVKDELLAQEELLLSDRNLVTANKFRRQEERRKELLELIPKLEKDVDRAEEAKEKAKMLVVETERKLARARVPLEEAREKAEQAGQAVREWKVYNKRRKRRKGLQERLEKLKLDFREPPQEPEWYSDLSSLEQRRQDLRSSIELAADVIGTYESTGTGVCPTCHQTIPPEFVALQRKARDKAVRQKEELDQQVQICRSYVKKLQSWQEFRAGWEADNRAAKEELETLQDLQEPEGDLDSLRTVMLEFEGMETEVVTLRGDAEEAVKAFTDIRARHEEKRRNLKEVQEELQSCMVPKTKLERAIRRLNEHRVAELEIERLTERQTNIKTLVNQARKELDRLRALLRRRRKVDKAVRVMTEAQEVFHWKGLPRLVAQTNLVNLEGRVNEVLEWFDNPFWVEADEDLGFQVHQPGHPPGRAESLSGGQKGVLAVAFRCAVADLFGADIGMMFLDEPTAGMDDENVGAFAEVLTRLGNEVRGKRQLVVVTHAGLLRPAFDQTIEISRDV